MLFKDNNYYLKNYLNKKVYVKLIQEIRNEYSHNNSISIEVIAYDYLKCLILYIIIYLSLQRNI